MDLERVLPFVQAAADASFGRAVADDAAPVLRPWVGRLQLAYAVEDGEAFELVTGRHLRDDRLDLGALHERALRNLRARIDERPPRIVPYGAIHAILWEGNLEATLLLAPDLCDVVAEMLQGDLVAAAPARDVLAVGLRGDPAVVAELHALVDRVWPGGDHLLSRELLAREDGEWRPAPELIAPPSVH